VEDAFTCSVMLKDSSLPIAGNLYLTGRGVYFYSNLFGFVTRKFMRFDDMQSIDKVNTYYLFPTGLVFASMNEGERGSDGSGGSGGRDAPEKEIRLMGLLQRCQSYDLIAAVWKTNNNLRPNKTGEVLVSSNRAYFVRDFVKRKEGYMYAEFLPLLILRSHRSIPRVAYACSTVYDTSWLCHDLYLQIILCLDV
jgi:hypothetical protein